MKCTDYIEYIFEGKTIFHTFSSIIPPRKSVINVNKNDYIVAKIKYNFYFQQKAHPFLSGKTNEETQSCNHVLVYLSSADDENFCLF